MIKKAICALESKLGICRTMQKIGQKWKNLSIIDWIEYRLPIFSTISKFTGKEYKVPKNLNYAWNFGVLSAIALVIQIVTGIILTMNYTPHVDHAFDSVERIMREVNYGWLIRYTHAVGASFFFVLVYCHMARGMFYGSYKKPRELVWIFGVITFLIMIITAFMGYVLPWGQMSFWAATVITNLFSAIPFVGDQLVIWILGGFGVGNPTLNRFFALHYLLPFVIAVLAMFHLFSLHKFGSNNPEGIEVKAKDKIPFHPYYTVKDAFTFGIYLIIFFIFVFYIPNSLGHPDNYVKANPLVTPPHIVPEWYFLPFYAILRAIPNKLMGVCALFGAILVLVLLPWLDTSPVKSGKYRPIFKWLFLAFVLNFVFLGWLGGQMAEEPFITLSQLSMLGYFGYFFALPFVGKYEKPLPLPKEI